MMSEIYLQPRHHWHTRCQAHPLL